MGVSPLPFGRYIVYFSSSATRRGAGPPYPGEDPSVGYGAAVSFFDGVVRLACGDVFVNFRRYSLLAAFCPSLCLLVDPCRRWRGYVVDYGYFRQTCQTARCSRGAGALSWVACLVLCRVLLRQSGPLVGVRFILVGDHGTRRSFGLSPSFSGATALSAGGSTAVRCTVVEGVLD